MAFIALCLWVVVAWLLQVVLTAKQSWPAAYGLIVLGVPIVIWLTWSGGWVWGTVGAAVMLLVLRWPVIYLGRWIRGKLQ
ncbi:DUF2484 family protein [Jannaschia donghaensis]|uniref:DUF2484 family protein n=1 Tax=Jannaschia donghaensis TaxID=420998 RepID=A0A0M6YMG9_9RHOB|nr:DUF2484 family protein [Jannaschia donghaensis]CTQ50236.1 hypothetical protein JDO7802_02256 [Jannaschia donghaensis]